MKTYSLKKRLIRAVLLVELCSALMLSASAGMYEGVSRFRSFDLMLEGRADSLLGAVQDSEDAQDNVMLDGTQAKFPKEDIYAVRDELGRILGHSANWPDILPAFAIRSRFRGMTVGGEHYRVIRVEGLRLVDPGDKGGGIPRHFVVLYGTRTSTVWEGIGYAILFYSLLSLALLGVSAWVMLRLLSVGLEPLTEVADRAAQVSITAWTFRPSNAVRQVRELVPLVTALEAVLGGLERSFEQQKEFLSDAAHELKTSVAIVKSSLQVMMMKDRNLEEYRFGLQRAERDCIRVEELVASMLTLAGLEAGTAEDRALQTVDINEVLSEVMEHFRSTAELSRVSCVLRTTGESWVAGERGRVRLLCSNLIDNALKHSKAGGEVRVLCAAVAGWAELRIEDDGEGIAPEVLPHIFGRFVRGDASRSRVTGGAGLGLAIVKAVVQSMKGHIEIASVLHNGTQVLITLPLLSTPYSIYKGNDVLSPQPAEGSASLKVGLS